jgi:hypothetical protein
MATVSFMDSQNLQKFELALNRLGASNCSKKQRPIVERRKSAWGQQEAVSDAAEALAALWSRSHARPGGGKR